MSETKRTIMTFSNEDKTALNLAQNLESPFDGDSYHEAIIEDAKALVKVGLGSLVYCTQATSTLWVLGDVRVRVRGGKLQDW